MTLNNVFIMSRAGKVEERRKKSRAKGYLGDLRHLMRVCDRMNMRLETNANI